MTKGRLLGGISASREGESSGRIERNGAPLDPYLTTGGEAGGGGCVPSESDPVPDATSVACTSISCSCSIPTWVGVSGSRGEGGGGAACAACAAAASTLCSWSALTLASATCCCVAEEEVGDRGAHRGREPSPPGSCRLGLELASRFAGRSGVQSAAAARAGGAMGSTRRGEEHVEVPPKRCALPPVSRRPGLMLIGERGGVERAGIERAGGERGGGERAGVKRAGIERAGGERGVGE